MGKSKFSLSRGLKDVFIAEVLADNADGYTVSETVDKLIPAGTITMSADNEKTDTYFDNVVFASIGSESATTVTIEGARLKPAMIAKITNKKVDEATGAVIDSGVYVPKYFAMSARVQMLDGTDALIWFMKGTFSIPEETGRTVDDTTDADGMTLEFSAVSTIFQFGTEMGVKRVVVDTSTTELVADADWFKQVVTPTNLATIVQKIKVLSSVSITAPESVTTNTPLTFTAVPDVTNGTIIQGWTITPAENGTVNSSEGMTASITLTVAEETTIACKAINGETIVNGSVKVTPTAG